MDIWTLVRYSARITAWLRNCLVLVYVRFRALNSTQYWSYAVGASNILRETLHKHALEHLEAARSEKKNGYFFFLYSKCVTIIDLFEGL